MGRFALGGPGTEHYLGSVGEIAQVNRVGTVGHLGSIAGVGTVRYVGTAGRVGYVARLGTQPYVQRLGSIGHLGSITHVGTVNRLAGGRLGTIGSVARVEYVSRIGTQLQMVQTRIIRSNVPLGPGTIWAGSWQHVGSYRAWAFALMSRGGGGSFAILGGAVGTATAEGTVYGYDQVRGSVLEMLPPVVSVGALPLRYVAPIFRRTGLTRGTVTVHLTMR